MEPSSAKFCGPGGVNLSHLVLGKIQEAQLRVQDRVITETVYVMKNQRINLLSKSAIENLALLKPDPVVYSVEVESVKQEFPRLFKGLGLLNVLYMIPLREDAVPV